MILSYSAHRHSVLLLALALVLALSACDSNDDDGGSLDEVDGMYEGARLTLVTDGNLIDNVNVLGRASNLEMEFFPSDGEFDLTYRFEGDDGETDRYRLDGDYDVSGGEVEIDVAGDDAADRRRLLLPDTFDLEIGGGMLSGNIERDDVNLGDYSEADYGEDQTTSGTLEFRLQSSSQ